MGALFDALLPWLVGAGGLLAGLWTVWTSGARSARRDADLEQRRRRDEAARRAEDAADRYAADGGAAERLRRGEF
jgi:hypothetical protein